MKNITNSGRSQSLLKKHWPNYINGSSFTSIPITGILLTYSIYHIISIISYTPYDMVMVRLLTVDYRGLKNHLNYNWKTKRWFRNDITYNTGMDRMVSFFYF